MELDRLGHQLLFTTVLITSDPSGVPCGTGFFFDALVASAEGEAQSVPVLVSNWHVVEGATDGRIRVLLGKGGKPLPGASIEVTFTESDWFRHPNADVDVAIFPFGPVVTGLVEAGHEPFYRLVGRDSLPSADELKDMDVSEPVAFVGYPLGMHDTINLTPITRRGHTATPVQAQHNGKPQFLIDGSVFPGSSGSPVFLVNEGSYRSGDSQVVGSRIRFLGVVAAFERYADVTSIDGVPNATAEIVQNIDLGVAYSWQAIEETIEEFCRVRSVGRDFKPK